MHDCNICYESFVTINILRCCQGKRMCIKCKYKYDKTICPFCRQKMNVNPAIIILNKNQKQIKGKIIMSVMNYNIIQLWLTFIFI